MHVTSLGGWLHSGHLWQDQDVVGGDGVLSALDGRLERAAAHRYQDVLGLRCTPNYHVSYHFIQHPATDEAHHSVGTANAARTGVQPADTGFRRNATLSTARRACWSPLTV
jgi:hypothetical protein